MILKCNRCGVRQRPEHLISNTRCLLCLNNVFYLVKYDEDIDQNIKDLKSYIRLYNKTIGEPL